MGRKLLEHFDRSIIAIEGGKFRGEVHSALKEEFRIGSVGGRIGKRGEAGFEFVRVPAGDGTERIERAEKNEESGRENNAEKSEPAHG